MHAETIFVVILSLCCSSSNSNSTSSNVTTPLGDWIHRNSTDHHLNQFSDSCIRVTLDQAQFCHDNSTGDLHVSVGYDPKTIIRNHTVSANDAVTVCYPLSPQLLTCNATSTITSLESDNFTIDVQHRLHHHNRDGRNDTVQQLGDYFIDGYGNAVLCLEPIEISEEHLSNGLPRCNYVSTQKTDHPLLIRHPIPGSVHSDTDCYPLAISFLNCPLKVVLEQQHFELSGHSLRNLLDKNLVDPANYFLQDVNNAVVCFNEPDYTTDKSFANVFIGLNILSALCLLLAVVYHMTHPKKNYTTKCHISYAIAMFMVYVAKSVNKLIPLLDIHSCYILYTVNYVSSLVAFSWLNIMAFDVCRFFCSLQTSRLRCFTVRSGVQHRFLRYSIFAWCLPLLLYSASMAVDRVKALQEIFGLVPGIERQCWFNERASKWAFYYGPLVILMALNMVYFVITMINLLYASRGTEAVNGHRNKQLFKISLKLFLVMGLCWISDILTFVITYKRQHNYYWYISSILTGLQGVAICLIYIIRRRNILHIKSHFCPGSDPPSRGTTWSSYPKKATVTKSDSRLSDISTISASSLSEDPGNDVVNKDHAPPDYETEKESDQQLKNDSPKNGRD